MARARVEVAVEFLFGDGLPERKLPYTKIVVLGTPSAPGLEQRVLWMGADAYIVKPMDAFQIPRLLRDRLAA